MPKVVATGTRRKMLVLTESPFMRHEFMCRPKRAARPSDMMAFMAFSTSFAKASSDVDAVAVEVIAWDFGSQNESNTEFARGSPSLEG